MRNRIRCAALKVVLIIITVTLSHPLSANDADSIEVEFSKSVLPLLQQYCVTCHDAAEPASMLDLSRFVKARDVAKDFATWQHVVDRVSANEMPPDDASQPTAAARAAILTWSTSLRDYEARQNAGDPGPVLARRFNATEYNNTIRDLTGVDIRPAQHFPVDPANQAGFDNSGESLAMTPGLLMKYLDAARSVSEHLLLKPEGIDFAAHPVVVDTDRDKYCVRRIVDFYEIQNTRYADYFFAAWRLRQRAGLEAPEQVLREVASEEGVSPKYLSIVWDLLVGRDHHFGPIAKLRSMWFALEDGDSSNDQVRTGCDEMGGYVQYLRPLLSHSFPYLSHRGINNGTQSFVLWRNRQYATHRRSLNQDALRVDSGNLDGERARIKQKNREIELARQQRASEIEGELAKLSAELEPLVARKEISEYEAQKKLERARQGFDKELAQFKPEEEFPEDLLIPSDPAIRARHISAFQRFCDVFPDEFYVKSRGRDYIGLEKQGARLADEAEVRLLSAGFHSQMGFFRDDAPLYDLMLSEDEQRELDALWLDLEIVADVSRRQQQGFIWYERGESRFLTGPEFDFARAEDEYIASEEGLRRLAKAYLAKAKETGASEEVLSAIGEHFDRMNAKIRHIEAVRETAEPTHLPSLIELASKAFRRPLTDSERAAIGDFYQELRSASGLTHEDAIRDVLVWILTSPNFCYITLPSDRDNPVHPLSQYALASRLSYFLWSSMPDRELLAAAEQGELHDTQVLKSQVRRMLMDDRIRGFAEQFGGNWLGYADFQDHKGVNRERFPQFDNELREAMYREPIEFLTDLVRHNGSMLDVLYADHMFVNKDLAQHYGVDAASLGSDEWRRMDGAATYGRGGVLSMAVFLTKNAHALRTSPVQRGNWVVRQLLGERIPPPPADVPELPQDESQLGDRSLVEVLAAHREHQSCAGCHNRFDSLGVALEAFGPIGELRNLDLGGKKVETLVDMPDGVQRDGVDGLRAYIREHRQNDFVDHACRQLLGYALGRTLIVSDDLVLNAMREQLERSDYRMVDVIETVVTSQPFLNQRGRGYRDEPE